VGNTSADGSAISNRVMGDVRDRGRKQRVSRAQAGIAFDIAPAYLRTQADALVRDRNRIEIGNPAQVNEQGWRGEPESEHRYQALTAGDRQCIARMRGEQRNRLIQRAWSNIVKDRQLQDLISL
jgi:hypothetical protein